MSAYASFYLTEILVIFVYLPTAILLFCAVRANARHRLTPTLMTQEEQTAYLNALKAAKALHSKSDQIYQR